MGIRLHREDRDLNRLRPADCIPRGTFRPCGNDGRSICREARGPRRGHHKRRHTQRNLLTRRHSQHPREVGGKLKAPIPGHVWQEHGRRTAAPPRPAHGHSPLRGARFTDCRAWAAVPKRPAGEARHVRRRPFLRARPGLLLQRGRRYDRFHATGCQHHRGQNTCCCVSQSTVPLHAVLRPIHQRRPRNFMRRTIYLSESRATRYPPTDGRVAERFKAPVLKTGDGQPSVGSNPTSSATYH